ncbi:hypothetical protein EV383_5558 [Pseudonocardia sediminis]|uniref:Uncharacterized protein n=1 Tax=Pseudonocardia sediminis TaxID=1397368 RepID=A0A4Q7V549_PSEST|nr:hypothetical protein [Pseudonocardia sediminis]RZT88614.1 hypothetical protein EV383_5558 [Pseudonocardia sediminis]
MTADPWGGIPRPPRPPAPVDPDELRVLGLRRRTAVARAVNEVSRGVHVRAFEFGWTVSTVSGHICVCHTLDHLLDVTARPEDVRMLRATALAAADGAAGGA